ncbi:MAG: ECF transporter S component [Oscillospiraceae bacterium]|jgi:riboflavin transporter FmnP|nr:ECF transporter S component [Oscillospiraceae bacterium]
MKTTNTKKLTVLAMLSALAFLLALLFHFLPIPPFVPAAPFLKFEPKDVVIVIAGFLYGPIAVIPMAVVVSLLEMPLSATWLYGLIMNVASTCAFACTAAIIYKQWRTISGAAAGLAAGVIVTTAVMIPLNYFITPFFMGVPRHVVVAILVMGIGLFNFVKYALVAAISMQLYIPLKKALTMAKLLPVSEESETKKAKINANSIYISIIVLILCALGILYLNGIIFSGG